MGTNTISNDCATADFSSGPANFGSRGYSGSSLAFDTGGNIVDTRTGEVVAAAPEPGVLALFGVGLAGLGGLARRRQPPALRRITSSA
jgi:hypothetical protein